MQVQINKQLILEGIGRNALIGGAAVGGILGASALSHKYGLNDERSPDELNNHIEQQHQINAGHEHIQAASFGDH